jgi:pyrroline-5-carboxylate reductase
MTNAATIGFIGVGALAEYTIKGIRRGGFDGRILLSPRSQAMAQQLARDCQCEVMASNQAVVDNCEQLVLSTRPADCFDALGALSLRPDQLLISVVAGVTLDELHKVVGSDFNIVRAMPVSSAEAVSSPTLIYPGNDIVSQLFEFCGDSIVANDEAEFNQGSVLACTYSWYFALFDELIKATHSESLSSETASKLVLGMAKGAANLALENSTQSPGEIAESIATEGTFSKLGLDILKDDQAFEPWHAACKALQDRLG